MALFTCKHSLPLLSELSGYFTFLNLTRTLGEDKSTMRTRRLPVQGVKRLFCPLLFKGLKSKQTKLCNPLRGNMYWLSTSVPPIHKRHRQLWLVGCIIYLPLKRTHLSAQVSSKHPDLLIYEWSNWQDRFLHNLPNCSRSPAAAGCSPGSVLGLWKTWWSAPLWPSRRIRGELKARWQGSFSLSLRSSSAQTPGRGNPLPGGLSRCVCGLFDLRSAIWKPDSQVSPYYVPSLHNRRSACGASKGITGAGTQGAEKAGWSALNISKCKNSHNSIIVCYFFFLQNTVVKIT